MEVNVWQEKVVIPTYAVGKPDKNPMFFEKRVYQGSSGVVYPNPVIEKIADEKVDKEYCALFLENDYLKIMLLPEIGGRVQMAYDKIAQRHFIYYNQVIKPALVGLCGPWISGGIEFNWPQHHRPSTFDPVDYRITGNKDGSKTVWMNELEKMFRTKGLTAFTLHPDKAYLEIKTQLFNRTNLPQTFLWWANPAVKVNDHYQSVFPPDVNAVFDHGKRDVSTFPIATGTYYKVDYSPGTDISRYKNIPVPTSYMAVNSTYDFVGGYEHDSKAGVLHVADHHISPGKKQWTWGNGDFGLAWDRNLTDEDGPYIELMTGVYTDNQPDFTWILPNEEKSFTQYFLPYRDIGLVKNATKDILIGLECNEEGALIKVFSTSKLDNVIVELKKNGEKVFREKVSVSPEKSYHQAIMLSAPAREMDLELIILNQTGEELISYRPGKHIAGEIPKPASPAKLPEETATNEDLYLTGQHLEQYRHATYSPVPYYEEALRRDPTDIRNNNALGVWYLRRGQFEKSESFFRNAIASMTKRNPNPYDSEAYYNLGLSLQYQGRIDEAYDAFFKSTWSNAWQDSGYFEVACVDVQRGKYETALEHVDWSLDKNARNGKAYMVKVHCLRRLGRLQEAIEVGQMALKRDGFNFGVRYELSRCQLDANNNRLAEVAVGQLLELSRGAAHNLIETAIDFARMSLFGEAIELLLSSKDVATDPMINYYVGYYWNKLGDNDSNLSYLQKAAAIAPGSTFPNRLEDVLVLEHAIQKNPADANASYYLGNLWYDKRQYANAIANWELSAKTNKGFPTVFRNLGIAEFNKENNPEKALIYFEQAFSLDTSDARVLMELDQLYKRMNYSSEKRLEVLEDHLETSVQRDDIYLEIAAIKNLLGDYGKALDLMLNRKFHPWEGGEGKVSGQYIFGLVQLAKDDIKNQRYDEAISKLNAAQAYPLNLGEGKLPGAQENDIYYWLGITFNKLEDSTNARFYWEKATVGLDEPSAAMFYNDQQPDKIFYQGLAWEKLGNRKRADEIFEKLVRFGDEHKDDDTRIDYFAVSLPDLLIFEDDLKRRNRIHCRYIAGLGLLGKRQFELAEKAFSEVLSEECSHCGAVAHLLLLKDMREASLNVVGEK